MGEWDLGSIALGAWTAGVVITVLIIVISDVTGFNRH